MVPRWKHVSEAVHVPTVGDVGQDWVTAFHAAWADFTHDLLSLPSPLADEGALLLESMSARNQSLDASGYFLHPLAYPTPQIICWVGEAYLPDRPDLVCDILTASIWLYLFIRMQDDVLDEPDARRDSLLLANVCIQRGLAGLMRCARGNGVVLDELEKAWTTFSAATAWERAEHWGSPQPFDPSEVGRLGEKFAAIRLPVAVILHYGGGWQLRHRYSGVLQHLGTAVQMENDLANWEQDLAAKNYTYFLALSRGDPDGELTRGIAAERCLMVAERYLGRALEGLPVDAPRALRDYLDARRQRVRERRKSLICAKLGLLKRREVNGA